MQTYFVHQEPKCMFHYSNPLTGILSLPNQYHPRLPMRCIPTWKYRSVTIHTGRYLLHHQHRKQLLRTAHSEPYLLLHRRRLQDMIDGILLFFHRFPLAIPRTHKLGFVLEIAQLEHSEEESKK